jgi:hypothetical protein
VASIELMDLSLGVDNVVAAVALSDKMWVVCTGVFIGILALRFVAGHCIKLIEKFPVLEHTAFLLIGFVGLLLVSELTFHVDIHTTEKFIGIVAIIAFTIWYSKSAPVRAVMKPVNAGLMLPVRAYDFVLDPLLPVQDVLQEGACPRPDRGSGARGGDHPRLRGPRSRGEEGRVMSPGEPIPGSAGHQTGRTVPKRPPPFQARIAQARRPRASAIR